MIDREWIKFASTGSIQAYLDYKHQLEAEGISGDATASMMTDMENTGRSVRGYGADHSADRYGIVGNPDGRI